jgi:hypothetical protein
VAAGGRLGRVRWIVERTIAWLPHFKRLLVRFELPDRLRIAGMSSDIFG